MSRRRGRAGTLAVLLLLGLLGPGPATGEPLGSRVAPVDGLVIVDAGGQVVGPLAGTLLGLLGLLRLRLDGRDLLLSVGSGRIFSSLFLRIGYESVDCTGPGYVEFVLPPGFPLPFLELAAVDPLNQVLVADGAEVTRTIASEWSRTSTPPCDPVAAPVPETVRPTTSLGTIGGFAPPFRLRRSE